MDCWIHVTANELIIRVDTTVVEGNPALSPVVTRDHVFA